MFNFRNIHLSPRLSLLSLDVIMTPSSLIVLYVLRVFISNPLFFHAHQWKRFYFPVFSFFYNKQLKARTRETRACTGCIKKRNPHFKWEYSKQFNSKTYAFTFVLKLSFHNKFYCFLSLFIAFLVCHFGYARVGGIGVVSIISLSHAMRPGLQTHLFEWQNHRFWRLFLIKRRKMNKFLACKQFFWHLVLS